MSIFVQEVLGLLNRNQKKTTLDLSKDYFEFGKLYQTSSLNNKSGYTPKMEPFLIKWGDIIDNISCQVTKDMTRTFPGQGVAGVIPVYTDPSGVCSWDTLKSSIITQNSLNTIININGILEVVGATFLNGNVSLGNNISDVIRMEKIKVHVEYDNYISGKDRGEQLMELHMIVKQNIKELQK